MQFFCKCNNLAEELWNVTWHIAFIHILITMHISMVAFSSQKQVPSRSENCEKELNDWTKKQPERILDLLINH